MAALFLVPSLAMSGNHQGNDEETPTRASHLLKRSVMSAGGSPGTSPSFSLNGTFGQPSPIGIGESAGARLYSGFWRRYWTLTPVVEGRPPEIFSDEVFQNHPNPFNPVTVIEFTVAARSPVELAVFNLKGQRIATLSDGIRAPGRYEVVWDGRDSFGMEVPSGVYLYRLTIDDYRSTKKMLLLK